MEIKKRKFTWIGHTLRKDDEQPSKVVLQWNPQGDRGRGIQKQLEEIHSERSWKKLD
jgi:hypothetical protein